jgi:hypothetical protein
VPCNEQLTIEATLNVNQHFNPTEILNLIIQKLSLNRLLFNNSIPIYQKTISSQSHATITIYNLLFISISKLLDIILLFAKYSKGEVFIPKIKKCKRSRREKRQKRAKRIENRKKKRRKYSTLEEDIGDVGEIEQKNDTNEIISEKSNFNQTTVQPGISQQINQTTTNKISEEAKVQKIEREDYNQTQTTTRMEPKGSYIYKKDPSLAKEYHIILKINNQIPIRFNFRNYQF